MNTSHSQSGSIIYVSHEAKRLRLSGPPPLVNPKVSQSTLACSCLAYETQWLSGIGGSSARCDADGSVVQSVRFSPVACINQPTGTGKTLIVILMVRSGQNPPDNGGTFDLSACSAYTQQFRKSTRRAYKRTLIVVGKGLLPQWRKAFADACGETLRVQCIETNKDVDSFSCDEPDHAYHATVVSSARYKRFMQRSRTLKWSRLVIDELQTCEDMGKEIAESNFTWLLCATVPEMMLRRCRMARAFFGNTVDTLGGDGFCIRSTPQLLEEERQLPQLRTAYLACASGGVHPLARQTLSEADQDRLSADAVTPEALMAEVLASLRQALSSAQESERQAANLHADRQSNSAPSERIASAKEALDRAAAKRQSAESALASATKNLSARLDEQCCVCYEDFDDGDRAQAVLSCGHLLCFGCALACEQAYAESDANVRFRCPQCRHRVRSDDPKGLRLMKSGDDVDGAGAGEPAAAAPPKPLKKSDTLIALVKGDRAAFGGASNPVLDDLLEPSRQSGMRYIVAAKYGETLRMLKDRLEAAGVRYATLRAGHSLKANMKRVETGEVRVVLLKSETDGSGLDGLQCLCSDWVFVEYHKLRETAKTQAVGRIHRYAGPGTGSRRVTVVSLHDGSGYDYTSEAVESANAAYASDCGGGAVQLS